MGCAVRRLVCVNAARLLSAWPSPLQDRAAKQAQAASDAARAAVSARLDHWLAPGIVVKVLAKKLTGYYKQKGVVLRVLDKYRGEIEMMESGDVLQVGGWVGG
jgi:DNA/RNA-binding protein KIN17